MRNLFGKIKRHLGMICLVLGMGVSACYSYIDTLDFQMLNLEDFTVPEELSNHVTEGVFSLKRTTDGEGNFLLSSPQMWLESGEYVIGINYKCNSDGNYCQLYSPGMMDEAGNIGVIYESQKFEIGEGRLYFRPVFSQDVSNLELRIFCENGDMELSEIAVRNTKKLTDPLWFFGFGVLLLLLVSNLMRHWRKTPRYVENLLLMSAFWILVFLTMLPYLNSYLIIGHDLKFHLARINGITEGLRNGVFPVRINPIQSYGYGYASAILYPQVFLYPAALLHLSGMSLMNSYKVLVFLIQIGSIFSSGFSFARVFGSRKAGIMGAFLYVLSINRLGNMYIRGDLGEMLAMIFFPLAFYGIYEIVWGDERKWLWESAAISGIFFSHILSTELVVIVTAVFCVIRAGRFVKEPKRIAALCKAAAVTVMICLWQIVPIITYARENLSVFGKANIYLPDRLLPLSEIFAVFSNSGAKSLGIFLGAGALLYLLVSSYIRSKGNVSHTAERWLRLGRTGLIAALITLAMTLWIFPWQLLCRWIVIDRMIKMLQFPWRLLAVSSFMLCVTCVAAVMLISINWKAYARPLTILICLCSVLGSLYFIEQSSGMEAIRNRADAENINLTDYLYFYSGQSDALLRERGNVITTGGEGLWRIADYKKQGTSLSAELFFQAGHTDSWVEVPLYYYPGYHASINGENALLEQGNDGVIRVLLPDGFEQGRLQVWFDDFPAWKAADGVSALSFCILAGYGFLSGRKKRRAAMGSKGCVRENNM